MNIDDINLIVGAGNLAIALWVITWKTDDIIVKLFLIMMYVQLACQNFYKLLK